MIAPSVAGNNRRSLALNPRDGADCRGLDASHRARHVQDDGQAWRGINAATIPVLLGTAAQRHRVVERRRHDLPASWVHAGLALLSCAYQPIDPERPRKGSFRASIRQDISASRNDGAENSSGVNRRFHSPVRFVRLH